jgi:RHS repeat-associated protein
MRLRWISSSTGQAPGISAPTAQSAINATNNQLAGPQGTYDAAGNQLMRMGMSLTYDAENRVKQTQQTVSGTTLTNVYGYDGEGRRVQRTPGNSTTWYVYDAMGQLAAEFDSSQSGSSLTTQFITTDHLGSTRAVADASGNLTDCHDYLPFGEEISATTGNRPSCYTTGTGDQIAQKFTGDERDPETQEDFFKARYFSGPEGRFRSIDPIGIPDDVGDPQQWNKYSYTRNNPLAFVDPDGQGPLDAFKKGALNWFNHTGVFALTVVFRPELIVGNITGSLSDSARNLRQTGSRVNALAQGFWNDSSDDKLTTVTEFGIDLAFGYVTGGGLESGVGIEALSLSQATEVNLLHSVVDQVAADFAANQGLASTVLSRGELRVFNTAAGKPRFYGIAVERLVADRIRRTPTLDARFEYVARPFTSGVDFVGRPGSPAAGLRFDITTPAQKAGKFGKYGHDIYVPTYDRP